MAGQVLAVASGKGGVGKTTTVVNLGVVFRRADHTVVLVDADLGMANLDTMLGITAESTLHDVLAGRTTVEAALVEEAPGFGVVAGSGDLASYPDADPRALGDVLAALAESYDYVLVDTGAGMSHEDVLPLGLADRVVLVTSPDPAAIGDTQKTAELAGLAEGAIAGLVVTMADESTDVNDVAAQVRAVLLGVIPFDATVRSSTASATPLEAVDPDGPAAAAYRELGAVLTGERPVAPGPTPEAQAATGDDGEPPAEAGEADAEDEPATAEPDETEDVEAAADPDEAAVEAAIPPGVEADGDEDEGSDGDIEEAAEPEPEEGETEGDADAAEPEDEAEAVETGTETEDEAVASDEEAAAEDDDEAEAEVDVEAERDDDEEELDDYLEEFEDIETDTSGGFFSRLRRLFR